MRKVFDELDALLRRILALERRTTFGGGGVPPAQHAVLHEDGESDELDIKLLGGYPDPLDGSVVLRGDRTFGAALGSAGAGQFVPSLNGDGTVSMTSEGHVLLVWWEGP